MDKRLIDARHEASRGKGKTNRPATATELGDEAADKYIKNSDKI